ncbi:MAG TPA: hypothetical protein VN817_02590 [Solirubrobacteraceae bacterium]|nr:hypothetical protein [Solirubrobacteraceae bacterium]
MAEPAAGTPPGKQADGALDDRKPLPDASSKAPDTTLLPHVGAVLLTAIAVILAPTVDHRHSASSLSSFFSTTAQIAVTLLVAIALFQGALDSRVAHRARRWLSRATFVYLGLATAAGVIGSTASVEPWMYRWLFGLAVGLGGAGLLTVLLAGASNIGAQHDEELAAVATSLAQRPASEKGSTTE